MDNGLYISINPGGFDLNRLPGDPVAITIAKSSGETISVDPRQAKVSITEEHPQVERMEGDWGAICEVFRKNNFYYASITGVHLAVGDAITIRYENGPGTVTLKVIDVENGRARIDPPVIGSDV